MWHAIYTVVHELLPYFLLGYLFSWVRYLGARLRAIENRDPAPPSDL